MKAKSMKRIASLLAVLMVLLAPLSAMAQTWTVDSLERLIEAAADPTVTKIILTADIHVVQTVVFTGAGNGTREVEITSDDAATENWELSGDGNDAQILSCNGWE